MRDSDYYLLQTKERTVYLQVIGRKRKQTAEIFETNSGLLQRVGLTVKKISHEDYNTGCCIAALPNLGKGIELSLIE